MTDANLKFPGLVIPFLMTDDVMIEFVFHGKQGNPSAIGHSIYVDDLKYYWFGRVQERCL